MDNKTLKNKLDSIKKDNYNVTLEEVSILTPYMLDNIGNVDSELRDSLIYSCFFYWIYNDKYSNEELVNLLNLVFDKYLFYKIGEYNTDSVFTRTFSVLLIPVILYKNHQGDFLNEEQILGIYENIKKYFVLEKDLRGYVIDGGWAHSVAHTADALAQIVQYDVIDKELLLEILDLIKDKVNVNHIVYEQAEDERLVNVVLEILKRNILSKNNFKVWIESFKDYKINQYPEDGILELNAKTFLRSLYFKLSEKDVNEEILKSLKN